MKWKRITAAVLSAGLCAASLGGIQGFAQEESSAAMGRYLETSLEVPVQSVMDLVRMEDGTLRLAGNYEEGENGESKFGLFDSRDGGETWELAASLPPEYESAYTVTGTLDRQGGGAAVVMTEDENSEDGYTWQLLNFEGDGQVQAFPIPDQTFITNLAVSDGGSLAALTSNGQVMTLDRSSGETVLELPASDAVDAMGVFQNQALLLTGSEIQGVDLISGEPQARDESLNEALYTPGANYQSMTSTTYPIVFAEEGDRLYYATEEGIFSHTAGGSVVEQIVDGNLCSLASPSVGLIALEASGEVFYAAVQDENRSGKILKYEYSADTPAVPETELTIYSLEDNTELRQAIVLYQTANPDVYINYQVGLTGEDFAGLVKAPASAAQPGPGAPGGQARTAGPQDAGSQDAGSQDAGHQDAGSQDGGGPGGGMFYGLRYDEFLAPLIKVVQRQGERIQALEEALRGLFDRAAS